MIQRYMCIYIYISSSRYRLYVYNVVLNICLHIGKNKLYTDAAATFPPDFKLYT